MQRWCALVTCVPCFALCFGAVVLAVVVAVVVVLIRYLEGECGSGLVGVELVKVCTCVCV